MNKSDLAIEKFKQLYICSQAVLYPYSEELGLAGDTALKISHGFGAGMGRKQEVCGAVAGAIMAIGLKYGRGENEGTEKHELVYKKVRDLMDAFEYRFGSINCSKLIDGCNFLTEEGRLFYKENNIAEKKCAVYVRTACELLEEALKEK